MIKILFAKKRGWFNFGSKLIMDFEGTNYSHVAIQVDYSVYDAVYPKSRSIETSKWIKEYEIVNSKELFLTSEQHLKFNFTLISETQKDYSFAQLALIYIQGIVGKSAAKKIGKVILNGKTALICSELVARVLVNVLGITFEENLDTIGLKDLEKALDKIGV